METSEQLIFPGLEGESLCSPQAFLASRPPWPGSEEARMMTVGSGRQCSMLFETSSPLGAFSRILLESSHFQNSAEYCYVWTRLDTRFALSAFQLTPLEQSIEDSGSSLLPTPIRKDAEEGSGRGHHLNPEADMKAGIRLKEAVAAKLWPTPTERDWKDGENVENVPINGLLGRAVNPSPASGSLNPQFVEWLMGFPVGWTELRCLIRSCSDKAGIDHTACEHSGTLSSRNKSTRSSRQSRKSKMLDRL